MYNITDIRTQLASSTPIAEVQQTSGLMRKTRMEAKARREEMQEPSYDPTKAIMDRIKKYQESAIIDPSLIEEGLDTQTVSTATRPVGRPERLGQGISGDVGGRAAAESYLGRSMDDKEWEMLVRATYAEATDDPKEQAGVMSVILNRAKSDQYPDSIIDVLNQPNQFQAVTGTRNNRNPSSRYVNMPSHKVLPKFEESVAPLLNEFTDKGWLNFTAGDPEAYGEGTNVDFLEKVRRAQGSLQIGGTIFGTVKD